MSRGFKPLPEVPPPDPARLSNQRAYRITSYSCIGFVVLVFSVALSRSLGIIGLLLPSALVGAMYLLVTFALDVLIYVLELAIGERDARR